MTIGGRQAALDRKVQPADRRDDPPWPSAEKGTPSSRASRFRTRKIRILQKRSSSARQCPLSSGPAAAPSSRPVPPGSPASPAPGGASRRRGDHVSTPMMLLNTISVDAGSVCVSSGLLKITWLPVTSVVPLFVV